MAIRVWALVKADKKKHLKKLAEVINRPLEVKDNQGNVIATVTFVVRADLVKGTGVDYDIVVPFALEQKDKQYLKQVKQLIETAQVRVGNAIVKVSRVDYLQVRKGQNSHTPWPTGHAPHPGEGEAPEEPGPSQFGPVIIEASRDKPPDRPIGDNPWG
jgi:hypothetical protein